MDTPIVLITSGVIALFAALLAAIYILHTKKEEIDRASSRERERANDLQLQAQKERSLRFEAEHRQRIAQEELVERRENLRCLKAALEEASKAAREFSDKLTEQKAIADRRDAILRVATEALADALDQRDSLEEQLKAAHTRLADFEA